MDYKLALLLRDAGFPWEGRNELTSSSFPTLSELIEACGDKFEELYKGLDCWASYAKGDVGSNGSTPEEAVARLWLALNKK